MGFRGELQMCKNCGASSYFSPWEEQEPTDKKNLRQHITVDNAIIYQNIFL